MLLLVIKTFELLINQKKKTTFSPMQWMNHKVSVAKTLNYKKPMRKIMTMLPDKSAGK